MGWIPTGLSVMILHYFNFCSCYWLVSCWYWALTNVLYSPFFSVNKIDTWAVYLDFSTSLHGRETNCATFLIQTTQAVRVSANFGSRRHDLGIPLVHLYGSISLILVRDNKPPISCTLVNIILNNELLECLYMNR